MVPLIADVLMRMRNTVSQNTVTEPEAMVGFIHEEEKTMWYF